MEFGPVLKLLLASYAIAKGVPAAFLEDAIREGDARSIRTLAKRHGVPVTTAWRRVEAFKDHVRRVCAAEGIEPGELVAA